MYVNNVVRLLFPEFESLLVLLGRMGCWRGCRVRGEVGEDWREMLSALAPPYIDSTRPSGEFYHLAVNMGLLNKGGILVCAGRKSA